MAYGTFMGLNTALKGLMAQQAALDVTGHNLANVNTEGYTRQRADLKATTPYTVPARNMMTPGQIGTGVEVAGFERLRDQYVDSNIRTQLSRLGSADEMTAAMEQLDSMFGEPGEFAVSSLMRNYFASLDDVAAHPEDMAARQAFAQAADAFANGMNQLAAQVADLRLQSDTKLNDSVVEINTISSQIAALNDSIRDANQVGLDPNDLKDERDRLMDQLATKVNFTYTTSMPNEEVTITMGTTVPINLVDPLVPGGFNAVTRADLDLAYTNGDITAGEVFTNEDLFQTVIPFYQTRLDDFVNSVVTQSNTQHAAGFDITGAPGGNLFNPVGTTAATMQFSAAVLANPRLIAAASSWAAPGEPGNGNNANALLALRSVVQAAPLNATWENFYTATVASVGSRGSVAQQTQGNQAALVDALQRRRDEVSGVSVDEEMANMLKFQHAYNASARILTTMDDTLDTLINRMGRVGL